MCTKVKQTTPAKEIQAKYKASLPPEEAAKEDTPNYNANGYDHPQLVVLQNENGRVIKKMQWGLMPNWKRPLEEMLTLAKGNLNARAETIFDKPSFKESILKYRCIIPVEGFFEYQDRGKAGKQPFFIFPKGMGNFNFCGIYSYYHTTEVKEPIRSFAIVTTDANEMMAEIHNSKLRMPLIIADDQIDAWLDPNATREEIEKLMVPYPSELMKGYEVSQELGKMGNVSKAIEEVRKNPDLFGEQGTMDFI
ncbi:MAG: SOS response-associated peptidase [Chryseobacterium sp.]|nr:MAG: SOS response-associated peptidase [Chryseobacterium sp.]